MLARYILHRQLRVTPSRLALGNLGVTSEVVVDGIGQYRAKQPLKLLVVGSGHCWARPSLKWAIEKPAKYS